MDTATTVSRSTSTSPPAQHRLAAERRLFQIAVALILLLPPALLYARAIADALLSVVAVLFLANRWVLRDRTWLRPIHIRLSLIFWAWVLLCTVIAGRMHALGEALALVRFFIFAAALEFWVLADARQRRHLRYVILAVAAWIVIETWQQYLLGTNIFGDPRWGSGVLTGPLREPRAGLTLQTLYFAAFLPPAMLLMDRPGRYPRLAGALLLVFTLLSMALIGQRMPMLLVVFGFCVAGLVMRRFRWPMAIALVILVAAVVAARVVSPETYATLVTEFLHRMEGFWTGPYAALYQRGITMVQAHPWLGFGFDGFRDNCADPRYMHVTDWIPVTHIDEPLGCTIHPHNYWLQIATDSGLVGVALFAALSIAWLDRIGHGMLASGRPVQVALFVSLCVALWPIASTTALFTVPNAGWLFLLIGWGLAEQCGNPATPAR